MAICIILNSSEAQAVAGISSPGYALQPLQLEDLTFALPEEVLFNLAYSSDFEFLNSKPKRNVLDSEWLHLKIVDE